MSRVYRFSRLIDQRETLKWSLTVNFPKRMPTLTITNVTHRPIHSRCIYICISSVLVPHPTMAGNSECPYLSPGISSLILQVVAETIYTGYRSLQRHLPVSLKSVMLTDCSDDVVALATGRHVIYSSPWRSWHKSSRCGTTPSAEAVHLYAWYHISASSHWYHGLHTSPGPIW